MNIGNKAANLRLTFKYMTVSFLYPYSFSFPDIDFASLEILKMPFRVGGWGGPPTASGGALPLYSRPQL